MKIVYATDIHGDRPTYERLLEQKADAILIGGDLCPGFDLHEQRAFLEDYLIPRLTKVNVPVLIIMGNDDYQINSDLLERADKEGTLHFLNTRTLELQGFRFAGYSYINPGPLLIRDWIKSESEIAHDIKNLKADVLLIHVPPAATPLDMVWNGDHVGSTAVRDFIVKTQPLLSLHGHIHESPDLTGARETLLGKTLAMNPGERRIVEIDLSTLRESLKKGYSNRDVRVL